MRQPCEYAVLRVIPRIDRGEFMNVGVLLYCQQLEFLDAAIHIDAERLHALAPQLDIEEVRRQVDNIARVCRGVEVSGPAAGRPQGERFRWLISPRSTVVQPSAVHTSLTADPAADLDHLLQRLVLPAN